MKGKKALRKNEPRGGVTFTRVKKPNGRKRGKRTSTSKRSKKEERKSGGERAVGPPPARSITLY